MNKKEARKREREAWEAAKDAAREEEKYWEKIAAIAAENAAEDARWFEKEARND